MTPASAADCEQAAIGAYLLGADDESAKHWEEAVRAALSGGDLAESARYAFWLGFGFMMRGQAAPASGWLSRAEALAADAGTECRASGYVLIPKCLVAIDDGEPAEALEMAVSATEIGDRFGDADLRAFGTLAHGQALIAMGEPDAGIARLDDTMVSVTANELGPITTGIVYCGVILGCMDLYDLRRASEWTNALAAWCDSRPGMVPFRGQCLVHRSQLEQAGGDWSAAMVTAQSACRALADPPHPALGLAYYQAGELHRLLGDGDRAADDFRLAGRHGYDPMPGLALLECERGEIRAASAMMQRAVQERRGAGLRPALLSGAVEIFRTTGDFAAARAAAESLSAIAARSASAALQATAAQATGSVLLADGNVLAALAELRTAGRTWQTLRMPYEAAKAAVLRGLACSAMGDRTSAEMEFDTARDTFTRLGALPDLEHVNYLSAGIAHDPSAGTPLSAREQEVLTHLVAGRSNREIAEKLVISPHTVARHVEHIYAKLGVTNRTAATAYAYEHHLV
jgi:DNA-binding NarL/FixJ family response regulator